MKQMIKNMSTLVLAVALTGCTVGGPSTTGSSGSGSNDSETYTVGILQLVQHPALDQATKGFKEVLSEEFGDKVTFDEQNAAGDTATANTIAASLVSEKCDLILANATASLQAVSSATSDIPVLGTAVTDYAAASCTEAINNVASPAGVPIIAAEENITRGCGIATLSISYYQLGRQTGEMAVKILKEEEKVSNMPVEVQTDLTKKYVKSRCDALGIKVPDTYEAIEE